MPHCDECGHHHINVCGCGCNKKACPRCQHHHGKKKKNGSCRWCECKYVESQTPRK